MNEEKIIHAEEGFKEEAKEASQVDSQIISDCVIVGIHAMALIGCVAGSKKIVDKVIPIKGFGSRITKWSMAFALADNISRHLPLDTAAVKSVKSIMAYRKKMKEVADGADSNAGEESNE